MAVEVEDVRGSSGGSPGERWFHRPRVAVALMVAAAATVYATYSLLRLRTFRASTYDLVIFDQAVRSYSRFGAPVAMVKGVHNGFGPDFAVLGDHFSPVLALLAPLYWIHDGPATLLVAQAVLLALAIVPIWRFTAPILGRRAAYWASAAYALSWPIAEALAFDFHEVAFAPALSALMVERHHAGRRGQAAAAAAVLLLVKEDMGLLLAGFGLYLLTRRADRRAAAGYLAGGLAATWLSTRVLIPAFGGDPDYYWAYGSLGRDLPAVVWHGLTRPWDLVAALGDPPVKLATMALLVAPLLLLPLLSPLGLTALPLLAERMLADKHGNWWEPQFHYNAFLVVVLLMAAVDGAARLRRRAAARAAGPPRGAGPARAAGRHGRLVPAGILAAAVLMLPFFSFRDLADPGLYRTDARERAAAAAAGTVPDGRLVEAVNIVGPRLSGRARVLLWDREPRWAPWVVADVAEPSFPFYSLDEQQQRIHLLVARGYQIVFRRAGYVVLTSEPAGRASTALAPQSRKSG